MKAPPVVLIHAEICQRMVTMSVRDLGVVGMPQAKCGAPIPRESCPFGHDPNTGCHYRRSAA